MVNIAGTSGNQVAGVPSPTLPLTVAPPAGVHFVAFVTCTQGALSVPPEFTEIYATDWTRVYYAAETPGSAWSIGAGVDPEELLAVRIIGTDVAITQPSVVAAASLTSPTATATEAGLAVRGLSALNFSNSDAGYPTAATLNRAQSRIWNAGLGVGAVAAVAAQNVNAGSVGSAAWTLPGADGVDRALTTILYPVPVVIPDTPTGLTAMGGDREVDVSFNPSAGADSYLLRWRRTDLDPPAVTTQTSAPGHLVRINSQTGSGSTYGYTYDGDGVLICAWDSGIRATHNEFSGRVFGGLSLGGGPWNVDYAGGGGHGTPVSANAVGAVGGVAKGAQIAMATPFFNDPSFEGADIIASVDWVLGLKTADPDRPLVVTMSGAIPGWQEGDTIIPAVDAAMVSLLDAGIPVILAAGNENINVDSRLSRLDDRLIFVGSTTTAGVRADSVYGTTVDVYAPCWGQTIASKASDTATHVAGYGTSFAAPMVAGVVAKIREANPQLSPERIKEIITSQGFDVVTSVPVGPTLLLNGQAQSSEWSIHPTTLTTLTLDGLDVGATYEVQIAAVGAGGTSAWSSSAFATTVGGAAETARTATAVASASAVAGAMKPTSGAGHVTATASASLSSVRITAGTAAAAGSATAVAHTTRVTAGTGEADAHADGSVSTVRTTTGTADVEATATATVSRRVSTAGAGVALGDASSVTTTARISAGEARAVATASAATGQGVVTTGTGTVIATATGVTSTVRVTTGTVTVEASAHAVVSTVRVTTGEARAVATASAITDDVVTTTGEATAEATATADTATVRTTAGTSIAVAQAGGTVATVRTTQGTAIAYATATRTVTPDAPFPTHRTLALHVPTRTLGLHVHARTLEWSTP